jgi:hypothetical protein
MVSIHGNLTAWLLALHDEKNVVEQKGSPHGTWVAEKDRQERAKGKTDPSKTHPQRPPSSKQALFYMDSSMD